MILRVLPDDVWGLVKAYAIQLCPRCGGGCSRDGNMPCWEDDLSDLFLRDRVDPGGYRRLWYARGGISLDADYRPEEPGCHHVVFCLEPSQRGHFKLTWRRDCPKRVSNGQSATTALSKWAA